MGGCPMEWRRCSGGGSSSSASSSLGSCSGSSWLARRWLSRRCPDSIRSVVDALQADKVNSDTSLTPREDLMSMPPSAWSAANTTLPPRQIPLRPTI